MRQSIVLSTVLFVALTAAAAIMLVAAASLGDAFGRTVLLTVAAALIGSGLTVFLLRMTSLVAVPQG